MKSVLFLLAAGSTLLTASCTKDYTCTCTYPNYFGTGAAYTEIRELESTNRAGAAAGCPENITLSISGLAAAVGTCDLDD